MPLLWVAIGAFVTAYLSEKWCARVVQGGLLASYIPLARDPALAQAYAHSVGISDDPMAMETFHRLLDEVRAQMASGRISFAVHNENDPSWFTVDLLPPRPHAAVAGLPWGYPYGSY